jgi:hypothetical protein
MRKTLAGVIVTASTFLLSSAPALALSPSAATSAYRTLASWETAISRVRATGARQRTAVVCHRLRPTLNTVYADYRDGTVNFFQGNAVVFEVDVQYLFAGAKPLEEMYLKRDEAMERLSIPTAAKRSFRDDAELIRLGEHADAARDLTVWQRAGFAPSAEPVDTKLAGALIAGTETSEINLHWLAPHLSLAQDEKLNAKAHAGSTRATRIFSRLRASLHSWLLHS